MGKKSKIILFSIIGVVVVAAIAVTLYFVLRNPMSLSESRMVKDLQNDKGLASQKISGFNFDFKVESIDYDKNKANSGDEELSLTAKAKSITRLLAPKNVKVQSYVKNNYYVDKSYIDIDSAKLFVDDPGEPDNNVMGVKITWTKSKGANKYDIYRKIVGGKFEKIKTTGNTSAYVDEDIYYIDDDSCKVKKCYYKVVARRSKSTSSSSTVRKITYIDPRKVSTESYASGMFLGWGSSFNECIDGYKIYRSTNGKNGKYSLIAKLSKNTLEFTDKNVEFNKTYYYKMVAYKGSLNSVAIITKTQYKPMKTVNVSVGATDDSVKKSFEKAIKRSDLGDTTVDDLKPYLRFTSLNKKIATISRDFVVTGVSKGQVKAKFDLLLDDKSYEAGFILINVN